MLYGVGIVDIPTPKNNRPTSYMTWSSMLQRCYSKPFHIKNPSYAECSVDPRWHHYSVFLQWFTEHYVDGYQLDKDLLVEGNKVYGPDTCIFLPRVVNTIFLDQKQIRGDFPKGVKLIKRTGRYSASISMRGQDKHLGYFATPEEAHQMYLVRKRAYIEEVAAEISCPRIKAAMLAKSI